MKFDFKLSSDKQRLPPMGLIVLQVDETIETEFRQAFNDSQDQLFVTRIPSGLEVQQSNYLIWKEILRLPLICYHSLGSILLLAMDVLQQAL